MLILSMLALALTVSKKSELDELKVPKERQKLNKRTLAAMLMIFIAVPLTIFYWGLLLRRQEVLYNLHAGDTGNHAALHARL